MRLIGRVDRTHLKRFPEAYALLRHDGGNIFEQIIRQIQLYHFSGHGNLNAGKPVSSVDGKNQDRAHRQFVNSTLFSSAALTNSLKIGCGLFGRDLNSG